MKIGLFTGSRYEKDVTRKVRAHVDAIVARLDVVVEGGASGLDNYVKRSAKRQGKKVIEIRPDYRRSFGPLKRNARMVDIVNSYKLRGAKVRTFGFPGPGSRGTWHCLIESLRAGLDTWVLQDGRWRKMPR